MKIVENRILNIVFQIAIAVGIAGLIMYLLQEIISIWTGSAYTVILVIADFIGIITLITLIVWMFISSNRTTITLNIVYLGGAIYVFLYSLAHFFVVSYRNNIGSDPINTGSVVLDYIDSGVSLIGLVAIAILSILMIVIISIRFANKEEAPQYVKFGTLIWLILIAIYDFSSFYYVKQSITFGTSGSPLTTVLGITFLPNMLELVFILFAGILLIFNEYS